MKSKKSYTKQREGVTPSLCYSNLNGSFFMNIDELLQVLDLRVVEVEE